jgi:cell division protein FtsZ
VNKFDLVTNDEFLILVVGIGGCGCNAVNMLHEMGANKHASLVAINTDNAALNHCTLDNKLLIGGNLTHGYGAGADPSVGLEAAKESRNVILEYLQKSDFVILVAGLGGGTGTGASPYIAELANELGKPCICVATLPFESEGHMRMDYAVQGLEALQARDNSLITLPNENLVTVLGESVGLFSAFKHSNEMLQSIIGSLVALLTETGLINVDFNDFCKVMNHKGNAILGVGRSSSEDGALDALNQAVSNPLARCGDLKNSKGIILQINCREEISMATYNDLTMHVRDSSTVNALILCGVALMPNMAEAIEVLVIATGLNEIIDTQSPTQVECLGDDPLLDIPTFLRNQQRAV